MPSLTSKLHLMSPARSSHRKDASRLLGRWVDEGSAPSGAGVGVAPEGPETTTLFQLLASESAARRGELETSSVHLDAARAALATISAGSVTRLATEARLELVLARRALRKGAAAEVKLHSRRALARLDKLGNPDATTRLAVLELQAATAIMSGAYGRAQRLLDGLVPVASSVGDPWIGKIQRMLGAIHARRGRPLLAARAYELAASRLREDTAPLEVAKLSSNLAMVLLMAGEVASARHEIERALRLRAEHGASRSELANSTAVLALVAEREGKTDHAVHWEQAVNLARQGPDAVLTAEIELRAATAATERGDHAASAALLATATERAQAVGRLEPTVVAMAAEARARLCLASGSPTEAQAAARESLVAYTSIDAPYHMGQIELLLGVIAHRRGDESGRQSRVGVACRLALRCHFELGWRPADLEVLRAAALAGDAHARRYCRTFGVTLESSEAVLLFDEGGVIEISGRRYELGADSLPFRLARLLVAAIPKPVAIASICQKLWPDEGFDERTANRLKVHMHRLRDLVGRECQCVLTEAATRPGLSTSRYRWNPEVSARIVARAPRRHRR